MKEHVVALCLICTGCSDGNICISHAKFEILHLFLMHFFVHTGWWQNVQHFFAMASPVSSEAIHSIALCFKVWEFYSVLGFLYDLKPTTRKHFLENTQQMTAIMRRYWLLVFLAVFVGEASSTAPVTPVLLCAPSTETDTITPLTDWSMIMSVTAKLTC